MDAHLFRRFTRELVPLLAGARLVKIQEPFENIHTFSLDLFVRSADRKVQLVLKSGRKEPFLFLTKSRISANASPSAGVMRLRKYAGGRSIRHALALWQKRELWLLMSGAMPAALTETREHAAQEKSPEAGLGEGHTRLVWLVLNLREGPKLHFADENDVPGEAEPLWPGAGQLGDAMENWQEWPVLTPALRRSIRAMDSGDAAALLVDLEQGDGDLFVYREKTADTEDAGKDGEHARRTVARISAWPLPESATLTEEVREDILDACTEAGTDLVLSSSAKQAAKRAAAPWIRKEKKLVERLELQREDEERLKKMSARREQGLLLQANLWQLPQDKRLQTAQVYDLEGNPAEVRLDPRYTVRENMERFFHTARRGERGLARIGQRTLELEQELEAVRRQKEACLSGSAPARPQKAREGRAEVLPQVPATVQLFFSSDGFVLLRGRSAKGNQDARRMASPHDLWVHVEGGPGAHVIIRRSHAAEDVPQRTLDEAGALAAAKSWLKNEPSASLNYCEIRHVRPLKGAGAGTMRMDKILCTRQVANVPDIEARLEQNTAARNG